jgi:hypothetical protein
MKTFELFETKGSIDLGSQLITTERIRFVPFTPPKLVDAQAEALGAGKRQA